MVAEMAEYLDNTNLKGETELDEDLPKVYAMYSEHYRGQKLSDRAVRSILEAKLASIGRWQTACSK